MNLVTILKQALKDPSLDIEVLVPSVYDRVKAVIRDLPKDTIISEWKHTLGEVAYEYHIHHGVSGEVLRLLYARGVRGGNPKMIHLYAKKELENLTSKVSTA